jgi:anaerobic magnesium-protoporphyrin IX monomethyl ester cyclase
MLGDISLRILMVVPRQKDTEKIDYNYLFPLGLGYISSVLKQKGYAVSCLNLNHQNGTIEELVNKELSKNDFDIVCTGGMTSGYHVVKKIVDTVKSNNPLIITIVGGIIITSEPDTVFGLLEPSFGVVGEGEETIVELLGCLVNQKDVVAVKGILFRDKDRQVVFTGRRDGPRDLDSIPYPDFDGLGFGEYLDHLHCNNSPTASHNSFDHPRVYPILGSRGCPFNCTFCYHYDKYRKRSLESIKQELNVMVKKYKINMIIFFDECLALDKKRLSGVCDMMNELRKKVSWDLRWQPQLTVYGVDKDILKELKGSGVDVISYGFESMDQDVLKSMNKPITPEMISDVFHNTLDCGIGVIGNFIFGDVAETKMSSGGTLGWWKKYSRGQINLLFIQPYPGSKIYDHCLQKGIIKDKIYYFTNEIGIDHWFNMTKRMSDNEIEQL